MPPFLRGPNYMVKTRADLDLAPSAHSSGAPLPLNCTGFPPRLEVGAVARSVLGWGEMPRLGHRMCLGRKMLLSAQWDPRYVRP